MSSKQLLTGFFSYLISISGLALAGVLLAPQASAQFSFSSSSCSIASGCNSTYPKKCTSTSGSFVCRTCSTGCPSGYYPSSLWGVFMSNLPGDDPDTAFNEFPVFGNFLSEGATVAVKCTQGAAAVACNDGIPAIQSTQLVSFLRSNSTLNLQTAIAGLPTPPFKIQVAGTQRNDGIHIVQAVSGPVLTLAQRPQNETAPQATIALASIKLQFSDKQGNLDLGQAYLRHFSDSLQCLTPTGLATQCEDGVAFVKGFFNAQVKCANSGPKLMLPCEISAFVGDGAQGSFESPAGMNNFSACQGSSFPCELSWSDAANNCKDFKANTQFAECQTLKVTIQSDKTFGNFLNRLLSTVMSPDGVETKLSFASLTDTPVGNSVTIDPSPDPVNAAQNGTITVKIVNDGKVNLANIVLDSVNLMFANWAVGGGGFKFVASTQTPTGCDPSGNCFGFKFNRGCFFDAYLAAKYAMPAGQTIPSGSPVPVNLVGLTNAGGEIVGNDSVTTQGDYLYGSLPCN